MLKSVASRLAAAGILAVVAALPPLGQQAQIATRPGSGVVRKRERNFRHVLRQRTPEQIAKHKAKLARRFERWIDGLVFNPCVSAAQMSKLTKGA
jgi:hypothetical protein